MNRKINIRRIIEEESIKIVFQPIVSTYQGRVAGVEALVRGVDLEDGSNISPLHLFAEARIEGMVIALDRLCQRKAIEKFSYMFKNHEDLILFLNVDNSVIHLDNNTEAIYEFSLESGVATKKILSLRLMNFTLPIWKQ